MESPQHHENLDNTILELLKTERVDSAKERQRSQNAFLKAIQDQTIAQTKAMNILGDRLEAGLIDMRHDLRSATTRTYYLIGLAILVVAALGGVSVRYMDGRLDLMQPQADRNDPPPSAMEEPPTPEE